MANLGDVWAVQQRVAADLEWMKFVLARSLKEQDFKVYLAGLPGKDWDEHQDRYTMTLPGQSWPGWYDGCADG